MRNRFAAQKVNAAAALVQRLYRAHRVKKTWLRSIDEAKRRGRENYAREMFEIRRRAAVRIQSCYRRHVSRLLAHKLHRERTALEGARVPVAQLPLVNIYDSDNDSYFIGAKWKSGTS
jgi:hypothetical protein